MFIVVWVYLRHYINLCILWAVLTKFRTVGPFELNWETQQYKCWISQYITFALLACLQAVNLFWLYLIYRIAKNFVFNTALADERSDNEEEEEEMEESAGAVTTEMASSAKQMLEDKGGMKTDSPTVLLNGMPMGQSNGGAEPVAKPQGINERKRRKG